MYPGMSLLHDLRFALRLIVKERWFTGVAVAALALGIGVNATVFTLVNAVLIKGLPFKDSAQLYMLGPKRPADQGTSGLSMQELLEYRAQTQTFAGLAGFSGGSFNLADERGFPEQANGSNLTANAFRVLGQQPLLGRDFVDGEDKRGAERVVILGFSLWKNRYASDPNVIGRPIRVNGEPATIVGVMPDNMKFPTNAAMWMAFQPAADETRSNRPLQIFGRLRSGVSMAQAQAEMERIAAAHATKYPETNKEQTTALVQTFNQRFNGGPIRQIFLAMMGAVGFVLLIACANVANLLLSRSASRSREIAVRFALGASRWRVVRQLLVESVVLGFMGGVFGLLLSFAGVRAFDAAVSDVGKPYWIQFTTDWTVIGYLALICVLTGVLFGLAPALQVSRTSVSEVLKEGGRGNSGGRRARWMSGTMVVVEIALTIILLTGAGVMTRSFLTLYRDDIGIKTDYLMTMRLVLPSTKYPKPEMRQEFFDRLAPRLASVPGAESVALATNVPPQGGGRRLLEIEGGKHTQGADWPEVTTVIAGPNYFETLGTAVRVGRGFNDSDGKAGFESVVINQRFAQLMFPGEDPIGRRIRFPARQPSAPPPTGPAAANQTPPVWRTIVGVVPTIRHGSPQDAQPPAVAYIPLRQESPGFAMLLVRSRIDPSVMMTSVRREVQAIDQDQPVFTVQTMEQLLAQQRWPFMVFGTVFVIFAVIALVLAAVGLYAVMAYSVTQRTQEIGVRMALGAGAPQVSWLILRRGLIQLAIGLTIGLTGAWFATAALPTQIVGNTPNDPRMFTIVTALLIVVALAACLIPTRRATRLDPLVALRNE
jgi:putative ABC transport system permease protein